MISITTLRQHLYSTFRMAKGTTVGFDVAYGDEVYEVTIRATDKKPIRHRMSHGRKPGVDKGAIELGQCALCGSLVVAGLCLNKSCTNSRLAKK